MFSCISRHAGFATVTPQPGAILVKELAASVTCSINPVAAYSKALIKGERFVCQINKNNTVRTPFVTHTHYLLHLRKHQYDGNH
jgi:hypothetical protein